VKPTLQVQAVRTTLEIGELELAGHPIQVAASVAPTVVEYVPAAQSAHTALPVPILYLPATHAVHMPPLAPLYPTSHVQFVCHPLPAGARELRGHKLQLGLPSGDH
jgi:hypothetical protein